MEGALPKSLRGTFWAYDFAKMDPHRHKKTVIGQILNWGDRQATRWLFRFYGPKEVARVASTIPRGAWDKKSLVFWDLILRIKPKDRKDKIKNSHGR